MISSLLVPERDFDVDRPEMIDLSNNDPQILADDLRNLRRINRFFGGWATVRGELDRFLTRFKHQNKISFLDLATGSADLPIALSNWLAGSGYQHHITAVDKNPQIVSIARDQTRHNSNIRIEMHDIMDLDYPDDSFDIVLCSLVLHHLSDRDAIRLIECINRISRIGFVLNDLNRSWIGAWTTWIYTHVSSRNPMTLHDSYLSVLRGFTPGEFEVMADKAGVRRYRIARRPFFRLVLTGEKNA